MRSIQLVATLVLVGASLAQARGENVARETTGVTAAREMAIARPIAAAPVHAAEFLRVMKTPRVIEGCSASIIKTYKIIGTLLKKLPYTAKDYPNIVIMEDDGNILEASDMNLAYAAKQYYTAFADDRDFLFVFTSKNNTNIAGGYNAYYRSVRNTVKGIGRSPVDYTSSYGSKSKLLGVSNMNSVYKWKNYLYPVLDLWPLGVITHELGHQWIAYVKTKVPRALTTDPNSPQRSHWQPLAQTEASIMYGNEWKQLTPAVSALGIPATFISILPPMGFSSLDKYLMGVHGSSKVKNFFWIDASSSNILGQFAVPGNTAAGKKMNMTVNDIIAENGARVPSYSSAQTSFKAAFILVVEKGKTPTTNEIKYVDYFRKRIPEYFKESTDNRFTISATPVKK